MQPNRPFNYQLFATSRPSRNSFADNGYRGASGGDRRFRTVAKTAAALAPVHAPSPPLRRSVIGSAPVVCAQGVSSRCRVIKCKLRGPNRAIRVRHMLRDSKCMPVPRRVIPVHPDMLPAKPLARTRSAATNDHLSRRRSQTKRMGALRRRVRPWERTPRRTTRRRVHRTRR